MIGCKKCSFTGVIEKGEKIYECQCAFNRRIAASMPLNIRIATVVKEHAMHPIINMLQKNLFINAVSDDMKAILKVIIYINSNLFIKITSDVEIRDVGVGSTSRQSRGDDAKVVYNNLHEFIDSPDLLIIELGNLKYKNKAAAGLLEEAINLRIKSNYIWLFSDKDNPFGPGSHSYSTELWKLIHSPIFTQIDIPRINTLNSFSASKPTRHVDDSENTQEASSKKSDIEFSDDKNVNVSGISLFGSGAKKKKKKFEH